MNKIESDEKLDFNNVLIRPKRSTINSRSEINLEREFYFKYSSIKWKGFQSSPANMDSTGTFELYEVLKNYNIITALHKFYTLADYTNYISTHKLDPNYFMVSTGIHKNDLNKLK